MQKDNMENAYLDFDDLGDSKSIQGSLEMYDYGEDFDCDDEDGTESKDLVECFKCSYLCACNVYIFHPAFFILNANPCFFQAVKKVSTHAILPQTIQNVFLNSTSVMG